MSVVFNGSQYATSTTATHTLGNGIFTSMMWVKIFTSGATATMSIVSEQNVSNNARQGIDIRYVNGRIVVEKTFSYLILIFTSYRSISVTSNTVLAPEMYHHIAVVWNGTTLFLYVNGVLDGATNITSTNDSSLSVVSNTLGARKTNTATWDQYYQGEILDYRKYTAALPEDQISTIATCSGLDFITQNLAYRYLSFGVPGTTATQIDDWSNNNFDRTITTPVTFG